MYYNTLEIPSRPREPLRNELLRITVFDLLVLPRELVAGKRIAPAAGAGLRDGLALMSRLLVIRYLGEGGFRDGRVCCRSQFPTYGPYSPEAGVSRRKHYTKKPRVCGVSVGGGKRS